MHLPNERIHREMYSEDASLWFTLANDGAAEAILLKAPTTAIKAIMQGCELHIVVRRVGDHVCWGARIFDVPERALTISGVIRHHDEHQALDRVLAKGSAPLFLYNEMEFCVAWTDASFDLSDAAAVRGMLQGHPAPAVGPFDKPTSLALDDFDRILNGELGEGEVAAGSAGELKVTVGAWTAAKIAVTGVNDHKHIDISNVDEGSVLEALTWSALESVFPLTLHHSPVVTEGLKDRELIDVVSTHEYGSFLIEAKDLSVLRAKPQRSHERRISTLKSHIGKAFGQLRGAAKAVMQGTQVRTRDGQVIALNLGHPLHCIVLVTEFIEDAEWDDEFAELCQLAAELECFVHVLDFRELVTLLKIGRGSASRLDYMLMERAKVCVGHGALHVRSRLRAAEMT
ncbi:hypothetical protein [Rhodanobacter sp. MP7CTX1]|uniref:hypothetical protein n=1 Tax=Rhodanobacter sp. MP7CTX1 TaxID=2723084 RepID=UPI00161B6637|nr:hypothetical protein [Rhodanobacter sp. MP7CTX1]MBB6187555.1 hypothetical protein [Rhodanobacter sp. MP7CTX1]